MITSWGGLTPCRLLYQADDDDPPVIAMVLLPDPFTSDVTSISTHAPLTSLPTAATAGPGAGALDQVTPLSVHVSGAPAIVPPSATFDAP